MDGKIIDEIELYAIFRPGRQTLGHRMSLNCKFLGMGLEGPSYSTIFMASKSE